MGTAGLPLLGRQNRRTAWVGGTSAHQVPTPTSLGLVQMKARQRVPRAPRPGAEEDLARPDIHFLLSSNLNTHLLHAK